MKRTKTQERAIIINFSLYLTFFIFSLLFILYYILPNISEIEVKKQETLDLYKNMKSIEKEGITFSIFKNNTKKSDLDKIYKNNKDLNIDYINGIIKDIDGDFFNENFKNNTDKSYNLFLKELENYYKNSENLDNKFKVISKILPSYSENIYETGEKNSLTDFKFVNYVESLIYNFNLVYNDSIGIETLSLLPNYNISSKTNTLDKNIYYINLELGVEGRKLSILEFLYYLQNVGKVYVDGNGDLKVFKKTYETGDDFYSFNFKKLSSNIENKENYNIFDNQIVEIEEVSFSEDIDSNFDFINSIGSNKLGFIKYLRNTDQMKEKFSAKITLRFYVKGLPKYKIEKFIKNFGKKFNNTLNDLSVELKNTNISSTDRQRLEKINNTLKNLEDIKKSLLLNKEKRDLTEIYNESYKYNTFLEEEINKIEEIKENYNKKKIINEKTEEKIEKKDKISEEKINYKESKKEINKKTNQEKENLDSNNEKNNIEKDINVKEEKNTEKSLTGSKISN